MHLRYTTIVVLASVLVLGSPGASHAATFSYTATLSGLQEVPPVASPASGLGTFVYDDVANTLTSSISFSGLTAGLTASHIHGLAAVGVNAGVIHGFPAPPFGATFGSWNDLWSGLTAAQVTGLNASQMYVNIHTQTFPGGEIRGQIIPDSVTPTRKASWGRIKVLYR